MEGYLFYLAAWLLWIYLVFLKGGQEREGKGLQAAVLLAIIASPLHLPLGESKVFLGGISLFVYSLIHVIQANKKEKSIFFIFSLIISLFYCSFRFFELFDPIVFIVKKEWLIAGFLAFLAIFLYSSLRWRLMLIVFGSMQGEMLYALVLQKNFLAFEVGGFEYLDTISLAVLTVIGWGILVKSASWLNSFSNQAERAGKHPNE
ncbi:hypothetical protein [Bacillus sp. FJAT-27445]|uniref:YphA family membrane protein n=1 Tax=Bacillus sp. FJAT-27445 TaxID=1679166 RepID=UPI000743FA37|nr:hypothetical protein [Bacillus sp. FJAT-27445]